MADSKISALTATTSIATDDMYPVATAAGATKKITGTNLRAGVTGCLETIVVKTADESVTDSSLQNDNELLFAITASATEVWFFEAKLYVLAANTTMDFKIGLTAPSGATARWGIGGSAGVSVNGWGVQTTGSTPSGLVETVAGPISVGTTAGVSQGMNFSGWVFGGGTGGNVVFQWAQSTTDAGTLTVKKGSFLRVTRLIA